MIAWFVIGIFVGVIVTTFALALFTAASDVQKKGGNENDQV